MKKNKEKHGKMRKSLQNCIFLRDSLWFTIDQLSKKEEEEKEDDVGVKDRNIIVRFLVATSLQAGTVIHRLDKLTNRKYHYARPPIVLIFFSSEVLTNSESKILVFLRFDF